MVYKEGVSSGLKPKPKDPERERPYRKERLRKKSKTFLRLSNGNVELLNDHLGGGGREISWKRALAPTHSKQVKP